VAWVATRAELLPALGLANIAVGLLLFLTGCGCLIGYWFSPDRHREREPWQRRARVLLVLLLLLSNFPACVIVMRMVDRFAPFSFVD
jgi:hypothetical protein